jgi:primosomal protein N' (replication factor Y) (superfamily II helicase)
VAGSGRGGGRGVKREQVASERLPVARVAVDISLAHLDRPFDYLVPDRLDADAVPGCRVRVRFAGQLADGFLLARVQTSEHQGRLAYLDRVVSPEPVLSEEIAGLARAVADRYAGALADVLRLAIPPRHATAERETPPPVVAPASPQAAGPGSWTRYPAGPAFLHALAEARPVRAAWSALPGPEWPGEIAAAAAATARAGRGTVIVVPDGRDLARVTDALTEAGLAHASLTADLGPAERYRRWLAVRRGAVSVAAGTRAAMFAPVADLGLVVLWDDGDDLHEEPRAPYPHAREVLALRAHRAGAAALIGGFARTAELTQLIAGGWAKPLTGDPRPAGPRVAAAWGATDDTELAKDAAALSARLPSLALRTAREALRGPRPQRTAMVPSRSFAEPASGPVLVQVPRRGYLASFACGRCRAQARCVICSGPLQVSGSREVPDCRWCGALAADWACPRCGGTNVRALVIGVARTAEELGRAFPGVPVRTSGGQHVLDRVPDEPALVIATPGAEPVAAGGYAGALLLDGWALLGRPSLRAAEEALRRWLNAAALTRPAAPVVVMADASLPAVQALIRWDPVNFAERELADRSELRFPPAVRMASVTAEPAVLTEFLLGAGLPAGAEVLGPVPVGTGRSEERVLIRADRRYGQQLANALQAAQAGRSARKESGSLRVQLDPAEVGLSGRSRTGQVMVTDKITMSATCTGGFVSVKPIRLFGDPVLRTPAEPVRDFDAELRRLVKDLTDTMLDAPGVGLAAPQIGVGLRVFTYHVDDDEPGHLINPSLDLSAETDEDDEGCLSFPGLVYPVPRIKVSPHDTLGRAF